MHATTSAKLLLAIANASVVVRGVLGAVQVWPVTPVLPRPVQQCVKCEANMAVFVETARDESNTARTPRQPTPSFG